jgi:putative oxidoreductase
MNRIANWLTRNHDLGILLLRLFIGIRLIYGVWDNVTSWEHMIAFRDFLSHHQFPFPLGAAIVSVYCQLLAGLCFIAGFKIRLAAAVMMLNFLLALVTVHLKDSFEGMTPALCMLFASLFFLFHGGGKYSLDWWINKKSQRLPTAIEI